MGHFMGDTTAPGLTEYERCALLGNAIGHNLATALVRRFSEPSEPSCCKACIHFAKCQFDGLCGFQASLNSLHPFPPQSSPRPLPNHNSPHLQSRRTFHAHFATVQKAQIRTMMICDGCDKGFHLHCLVPPRSLPPSGNFPCPRCDPNFTNQAQEIYNQVTPLAYRPHDPFLDKALLRYLHLGILPPDITPFAESRSTPPGTS